MSQRVAYLWGLSRHETRGLAVGSPPQSRGSSHESSGEPRASEDRIPQVPQPSLLCLLGAQHIGGTDPDSRRPDTEATSEWEENEDVAAQVID